MDTAVESVAVLGVMAVCAALGLSRAALHRRKGGRGPLVQGQGAEGATVPRTASVEVYATLLDEKRSLCSERTMYRILDDNREVRERRAQPRHPAYAAPQLLATRPNEVWTWDITKRLGPEKWSYFYTCT